ncbi:HK97 family phage major capsid protein [Sphingobium wenxiniae]|uniref:HK97 family phage major capsid protein n=1 Tax=Sphingobium wenxiniae (strain DSM 21828 / CGMCC 1.7748 / JZ-1) TaxID=595605 RepID=A0A562KEI9_SPHWJ|nr:phage major capsid protein [Sphingobium wenxiniae]MBB6190862.1 HK97 family phage major capsid protein [Sphingobium wenxiniae]TWH93830.1 HK97 family phage major capsid protein [Sphingobium wenxiniae]
MTTELHDKRGRLVTQAREALDEIKANTDESRTAELEARHDMIMADFDKVEVEIAREERTAAAEARADEARARQRPHPKDSEARGVDEVEAVEYRTAFAKAICGPLEDLTQEERAVLAKGRAEFRAQTAGTTTAGGFTVPTELSNQIIKSMLAWGPMYDGSVVTEMVTASGNPIKIPTTDDTAVPAVKHTEATALTDDGGSDVTFGQKSLDAYAYDTEFIRWSWELDTDSIFNMEALLGSLLGERLGRIANRELTIGDGTGDPNGIVTASTLGVTTASATAIIADELIDLVHSVDPAYRTGPKVGFMFNDSTLKLIRKLKDGAGNYLWQMGDVRAGVPGSLLGYNYHVNQAIGSVPGAAAAARVAVFGDFGKYFVRKVGAPVIGVMRERFWPDLGIAGLIRFDGELGDTAAVKHLITKAS